MTAPIPVTITGYNSFNEMYRSERAFVYGIVLRITNDKARADDLTQDSFLKVFLKFDSYVPQEKKDLKESLRNWLGTIAKNTALSYLKRQNMQQGYLRTFRGEFSYGPQKNFTPEELVMQKQAVNECIDKIVDTPYRETAKLRFLEDLSYQEISRRENVPLGTVMSRLNRARKKLQENEDYV